jgi:hypothetical protein
VEESDDARNEARDVGGTQQAGQEYDDDRPIQRASGH